MTSRSYPDRPGMLSLATAPLTDLPALDTPRCTAVTTPDSDTLDTDEPAVLLTWLPLRGVTSSLLPPVPSLLLEARRRRPPPIRLSRPPSVAVEGT